MRNDISYALESLPTFQPKTLKGREGGGKLSQKFINPSSATNRF